jgi:hypothetical protein
MNTRGIGAGFQKSTMARSQAYIGAHPDVSYRMHETKENPNFYNSSLEKGIKMRYQCPYRIGSFVVSLNGPKLATIKER